MNDPFPASNNKPFNKLDEVPAKEYEPELTDIKYSMVDGVAQVGTLAVYLRAKIHSK